MPNVIFVAPFYAEATLRFAAGCAAEAGGRMGLISQEPLEALPGELRRQVAQHWRVGDALQVDQLATAVSEVAQRLGKPDRLLGVLEQLQEPLAEVRRRLGIPGLGPEAARNFRDKARMKTVLRRAGVPCARHRLAESSDDALAFAAETGFPLVVKPPAGAGARSTFRVDGEPALREALAFSRPAPGRPMLLEEFVTGEEHSFDVVTVDGRPVWHSLSRYLPSPLEVLREPWIQWSIVLPRRIDEPLYDPVRSTAYRTLEALGAETGLHHMEWFRRPDGSIAVSEIAARPPGAQLTSLISWAHDFDLYRAWARLMVHGRFDPPARRFAAGAVFLRGQGGGRVKAIHGLDAAQRELGELVVEARLPRPRQPASGTYEGEGYVLLRHPETAVVLRALERLLSLVRVEMAER